MTTFYISQQAGHHLRALPERPDSEQWTVLAEINAPDSGIALQKYYNLATAETSSEAKVLKKHKLTKAQYALLNELVFLELQYADQPKVWRVRASAAVNARAAATENALLRLGLIETLEPAKKSGITHPVATRKGAMTVFRIHYAR